MPNLRIVFAGVFIGLAWPAWAQTPQIDARTATVGMPGCQSDVAISARRERISLTSQGREVSALIYEPLGEMRRHAALVIMHNRGIRDDVSALDDHAIQLASRGFAVILPFYLDAEREQTEPSRARAAHRTWRGVALDSADAIAAEVGIQPGRVILWGSGRGGGIALAAALQPDRSVGGAVGINIGGVPQDDAQGIGKRFLLIHSSPSRLMPSQMVRSMADKIEERGGNVERVEIAAEAGEFETADWCRVMDSTRELLEMTASTN